jgi:hypothetical protein
MIGANNKWILVELSVCNLSICQCVFAFCMLWIELLMNE